MEVEQNVDDCIIPLYFRVATYQRKIKICARKFENLRTHKGKQDGNVNNIKEQ